MKVKPILLSLLACAMLAGQVHAEEYTFDESGSYQYGTPTSMEEVHTEEEPENTDRSKNVALIPPGFGTPTSYLPGSGEYLTPNLVPGALSGGLVEQVGEVNYPAVDAGAADATAQSAIEVNYQPTVQTAQASFTDVTDDLYYSGGHLGTLSIPRLSVNVRIYEGTSSAELAKGAAILSAPAFGTEMFASRVCAQIGHD